MVIPSKEMRTVQSFVVQHTLLLGPYFENLSEDMKRKKAGD